MELTIEDCEQIKQEADDILQYARGVSKKLEKARIELIDEAMIRDIENLK